MHDFMSSSVWLFPLSPRVSSFTHGVWRQGGFSVKLSFCSASSSQALPWTLHLCESDGRLHQPKETTGVFLSVFSLLGMRFRISRQKDNHSLISFVSVLVESIVSGCLLSSVWIQCFVFFLIAFVVWCGKVNLVMVTPSWLKEEVDA